MSTAGNRGYLLAPILAIWMLSLVTFSLPGRDGPMSGSLDVIALAKVIVRFLSLGLLGWMILARWGQPRTWAVMGTLLPFWLYLGWAFLSVGWSVLPMFSFGQALGLLVMLLLATVLGLVWQDEADLSCVLHHLAWTLLLIGAIIVAVDTVNHDFSGLNREEWIVDGSSGIVHPTSAGATASLGIVVVAACWLLWGWSWTKRLLLPTFAIQLVLLTLANSRMAMVMGLVVLSLILFWFSPRQFLSSLLLLSCLGGLLYLCLDPDLALYEYVLKKTTAHVSRGESTESLTSLTGRTALWEAIWASWLRSPIIGHGYFVTSYNGLLDVWSMPANRSAHNVFLQVLVTTGIVGFLLFLWALGQLLVCIARVSPLRGREASLPALVLVLGLWYLGWTQLCESFMGPIQPEAVVFYVVLGLGLGLVGQHAERRVQGGSEFLPSLTEKGGGGLGAEATP